MNPMKVYMVICGCAAMLAACAVADDYIRLTAGDTGDETSFTMKSHWSDNNEPHPDADYIVTNNRLLRAPKAGNEGSTTNHVFGGRSLTIGTPTSPGQLGVRTIKNEKTTVDNLIFVNGQLRQIVGNRDTRLHGAITVQSPSNAPFCVQSASTQTRTIHIDATVSGAEGTGLLFKGDNANSQCTTMLQSANTNYFGTLTIGGGSGNSLILNNSWAAGGEPSTYTPKGLVVKDGATLRFNAEPFSYTNRGLYVESTGGVLYQFNINTHAAQGIAVTLISGSVGVSAPHYSHRMAPGEQVSWSASGAHEQQVDLLPYTNWRDGFLYYDQQSLESILSDLARNYRLSVRFNDRSAMHLLTHFVCERGADINTVVTMLNQMGKARIRLENSTLVVTK